MAFESFASSTLQVWATLDFSGLIIPLFIYALLLALYAAFVWYFYKSVSRRDLLKLNFGSDNKLKSSVLYVLKYLFTFPVLTFVWFTALSLILFLLSKSQTTENILLISMAVIAAGRITAYYKEGIAEELAKILPLAVLGIFIVDPTYFSIEIAFKHLYNVPGLAPLLINYLFFTVLLEFVLRILFLLKRAITDGRNNDSSKAGKKKK